MALSKSKLQDELLSWMSNTYSTKIEGITAFATAYENYAKDAISTAGGSYSSANKALTISTLDSGLLPIGVVATTIIVFSDAISKFWSGASLSPSVVTSFSACNAALLISLVSPFNNLIQTVNEKAEEMATAIHNATILVVTYNSSTLTYGVIN